MLPKKAGAVCSLTGLQGWDGSTPGGRGNAASCKGSSGAPVFPTRLVVPVSLMNAAAKLADRRLGSVRGVAWAGDR